MLAVPPALLELLELRSGAHVRIDVEDGRLIVTPRPRPRYTLEELLAQCDKAAPDDSPDDSDDAWLQARPVGKELF